MALRPVLAASALALLALALTSAPDAAGAPNPLKDAEKLLKSKQRTDRLRGLKQLEELGRKPKVEAAAARALSDKDWSVQIEASRVLSEIGGKDSIPSLARLAVEGEIHWVRQAAADAVAKLDPDSFAFHILSRAKGSRDEEAWIRGFTVAAPHVKADDLKLIRPTTRNKDPRVAGAAMRTLAVLTRDDAAKDEVLKTLRKQFKNRDKKKFFLAYSAAVAGLAAEGSAYSLEAVTDELIQQEDDDQYLAERVARIFERVEDKAAIARAIGDAIGRAKKPAALRRLARLAGRIELAEAQDALLPLLGHKDARVRSESARALGLARVRAAAPKLEELLSDKSPFVRVEAVSALARTVPPEKFRKFGPRVAQDKITEVRVQFVIEIAKRGDPAGVEALAPLLEDKAWRVSSAAAATIGTLGNGDDIPRLVPLLKHRNWRMRGAAYEGLARLRHLDTIPHLANGLDDKDPVVRGVCYASLQILSQESFDQKPSIWLRWFENNKGKLKIVKQSRLDPAEQEKLRKRREANKRYANQEEKAIAVLQNSRMIAITGAWDKVELVLNHLSIPVNVIRAQHIKNSGLNPNQIVLINCEGNVDEDARERLRWFVNVGGTVMSTDWALTKAIKDCWPGYVVQFSGSSTGNDVVVVERASQHPFVDGIFEDVHALKWWLEVQAFPMTVVYPERCEVLVDSAIMRQKYGSSPMCVTFEWGLGTVTHALSHFYLQEEGMQDARDPRDRMIFAADNLGLSLERIRLLEKEGRWSGRLNEETMKKIAPDYSMFRMIVNVVSAKADWVENL